MHFDAINLKIGPCIVQQSKMKLSHPPLEFNTRMAYNFMVKLEIRSHYNLTLQAMNRQADFLLSGIKYFTGVSTNERDTACSVF